MRKVKPLPESGIRDVLVGSMGMAINPYPAISGRAARVLSRRAYRVPRMGMAMGACTVFCACPFRFVVACS